jgi:hypothetical protein
MPAVLSSSPPNVFVCIAPVWAAVQSVVEEGIAAGQLSCVADIPDLLRQMVVGTLAMPS